MQLARSWMVFSIALAFAGVGCTSTTSSSSEEYSDSYALGEMNASYGAFADEGSLRIYTALLGTKGFVRLRGGDAFEIDVNGARVPSVERVDLDGKVHYIAEITPAPAGDTDVAITFVRNLERVKTTMKLYKAFVIKSPPASVKLGQSVAVDVDPAPDLSKWPGFFGPSLQAKAEVGGSCIEGESQQIDLCSPTTAPGKCEQSYPLSFDSSKLKLKSGASGCDLAVQTRLTSSATPFEALGPAKQTFKGGGMEGYRLKSFSMQLTP